jgi:hypothetical protein
VLCACNSFSTLKHNPYNPKQGDWVSIVHNGIAWGTTSIQPYNNSVISLYSEPTFPG